MNVFESIGLTADPFSTSPSIELFYNATRHKQCLEGLELAIRMKRGLSVVRGGIGVGKTTLSRKLIENFKSETDVFEFHLMLDPKFESELELLKHIIELFGIENSGDSVQENRNIIENHLLKVGVDDGKILTLIVDEGQNMPENMLDVFRTLLNFEANDYKLLQLIIFGQPEMGTMIKKYPNFEDRISFDFELGPLSLQDTTGFIHYRMKQVSGEDREWFSQQVIENIYKKTGGYPRKITQVCHELLLSLLDTDIREIDESIYNQVFNNKAVNLEDEADPDKKDYSSIAVNKLLDVLRKDSVETEEDNLTDSEHKDDDWIGAPGNEETISDTPPVFTETQSAPPEETKIISSQEETPETLPPVIEKPIPVPVEKQVIESDIEHGEPDVIGFDTVEGSEDTKEPGEHGGRDLLGSVSDVEMGDNPIKNIETESKKSNLLTKQLPDPGRYPFGKKSLPTFSKKYVHGFSIDNGKFRSAILADSGGKKKIISLHRLNAPVSNPQALQDPNEFGEIIAQFFDDISLKLNGVESIDNKVQTLLKDRSELSISVSGISLFSRVIKIAKGNSTKPQEIIEWAMKTNQPFQTDSLKISDAHQQPNGTLISAAADETQLENYGDLFRGLNWIINRWVPEAISIFNAFTWNYPDYSTHTSIIFHLGETHSFILACKGNCLLQIEPVHIGIGNLYETIKDQKTMIKGWFDRSKYQIPSVLLSEFGIKEDSGLFDNEFRSIIDSWRQSFNRCLTSIKKNHPLDETTKLILSGSLAEIDHSSQYFELAFGFPCEFLNPFRNLEIPQDTATISPDIHPSLFTVAIGDALSSMNSVNLLPAFFNENEKFRFVNNIFLPAAAVLLVSLLTFSGFKYSKYAELKRQVPSIRLNNENRKHIDTEYSDNIKKRKLFDQQIKKLSYDINYANQVSNILKYLSNVTDRDIQISNFNFGYGWELSMTKMAKGKKMTIREQKEENSRFFTIYGRLKSNPALQLQYFQSFQQKLKYSGFFYDIIVLQAKPRNDDDYFDFGLRCEF